MTEERIRAFIRPSPRHSEKAQRTALEGAAPGVIIVGDNASNFIRQLRRGDVALVVTLARLASTRRALDAAMDAVHAKGVVIVEAATGRRSDKAADVQKMLIEATDELATDRRALTPKQARKFGKMGGRPVPERLPEKDAEREWFDVRNETTIEALIKCPGWTLRSLYRAFGPRRMGAGRPRLSEK